MTGRELRDFLLTHNDRETAEHFGISRHLVFQFRCGLKMESFAKRQRQERIKEMALLISEGYGYGTITKMLKMWPSSRVYGMFREARVQNDRLRTIVK